MFNMSKIFSYRDLGHMSHGAMCVCEDCEPFQFIEGVPSLSDQIKMQSKGGLPVASSPSSDSNYDEADTTDVDPAIDPSLDRFERAVRYTDILSEREVKKHKNELEHAEV